jgi:hypothetical protein
MTTPSQTIVKDGQECQRVFRNDLIWRNILEVVWLRPYKFRLVDPLFFLMITLPSTLSKSNKNPDTKYCLRTLNIKYSYVIILSRNSFQAIYPPALNENKTLRVSWVGDDTYAPFI